LKSLSLDVSYARIVPEVVCMLLAQSAAVNGRLSAPLAIFVALICQTFDT
jgi:hypothetical protein